MSPETTRRAKARPLKTAQTTIAGLFGVDVVLAVVVVTVVQVGHVGHVALHVELELAFVLIEVVLLKGLVAVLDVELALLLVDVIDVIDVEGLVAVLDVELALLLIDVIDVAVEGLVGLLDVANVAFVDVAVMSVTFGVPTAVDVVVAAVVVVVVVAVVVVVVVRFGVVTGNSSTMKRCALVLSTRTTSA